MFTYTNLQNKKKLLQCGFTLLEILVAIVIFSIILSSIYSVFFFTQRAINEAETYIKRIVEGERLMDTIRKEIEASANKDINIENRDIFGKEISRLYITGSVPEIKGFTQISYLAKNQDSKIDLYKVVKSSDDKEQEIQLMEDIEGFTIKHLTFPMDIATTTNNYKLQFTININKTVVPLTQVAKPMRNITYEIPTF